MLHDKVSVITPTYNSERFIAATINSVLEQTYGNWEMIIVDDCSSDDTCRVVQKYAKADSRIRLIRFDRNSGAAHARNTAIGNATGRYIAFLDSDDLWLPRKIETQIEFMIRKESAFSYTAYEKMDEDGARTGRVVSVPGQIDYKGLLGASVIGCLTAVYDTAQVGKVYMPQISRRQDHGLWLKILKQVRLADGLNEPLACLRIRKGSLSSNKVIAAAYVWKLYREVEELSFFETLYYFTQYAARASVKRRI